MHLLLVIETKLFHIQWPSTESETSDLLGVSVKAFNNTGRLEVENNYKLGGNNFTKLSTA